MLKKIAACIIVVIFFVGATPVFGKDAKGPTPNKKAYEHASDKARFNRAEGVKEKDVRKTAKIDEKEAKKSKSDAEKAAKKAEKAAEKAKREAGKEAKRAEKEAKKAEREARKKQREMEREARKAEKGLGK